MTDAIASYVVVLVAILLAVPIVVILIRARRSRVVAPNDPAVTTGFNTHLQSELTDARARLATAQSTIEALRTELERTRTGPRNAG